MSFLSPATNLIMKNCSTTTIATVKLADRQSPAIDRIVQKFTAIMGACIVLGAIPFGNDQAAAAQRSCKTSLGRAVEGQKVYVDLCSVYRDDEQVINFTYYLERQEIHAYANCDSKKPTWSTLEGNKTVVHSPRSEATRIMLKLVCSTRY